MLLRQDEANKLAQELSDRKKVPKSAMFNDKLASFIAFPSIGDVSLGELAFTNIQMPFKKLDMTTTSSSSELKPVDIRTTFDFDFVMPLDDGQCIVTFKWFNRKDNFERLFTQINSFDLSGRLIGSLSDLEYHVDREKSGSMRPQRVGHL